MSGRSGSEEHPGTRLCPGGPGKAFVPAACNGFQERASIFAANRGTKDVEGYCGLQRGANPSARGLARRVQVLGGAAGGVTASEQLSEIIALEEDNLSPGGGRW